MCPGGNPVLVPTEWLRVGGDTGNASVPHRILRWCHCGIDRQLRESQSSWSSRGCPRLTQILCYPSKHTHTPLPQCTVYPSCCNQPFNPISVPFFFFPPTDRPSRQARDPNYTISNNKSLLLLHNGAPRSLSGSRGNTFSYQGRAQIAGS